MTLKAEKTHNSINNFILSERIEDFTQKLQQEFYNEN